uniref:NADH-ubiquinone oxidoreductase chain 4 n=1 Tax=Notodoris gardineri TaxID=407123 RepID=E6Y1A3_NOTGA|nr:NADH dehydrogenase subunit 4 [Notodoris gardineri]ABL09056.1 NADH dehydrogenase subunit 4 [Notodoris gardineri]
MISMIVFMIIIKELSDYVFSYTFVILKSVSMASIGMSLHVNGMFISSSLSNMMVILTMALIFLVMVSTPESKEDWTYYVCINSLAVFLVLAFKFSSLLGFYISFEACLLPTLLLIVSWGYQPERLQAGTYMMLYTVGASLPLLLMIVSLYKDQCSLDLFVLSLGVGTMSYSSYLYIPLFAAFLVKLPMYGVHLWLPKAHVEAPLSGSMILAGILLKLGGYGMIFVSYCFNTSWSSYSVGLVSLSMWGGFLATLMCLRQVDVKSLVAYSSVGHMSIVAAGILMDTSWGLMSAVVTMVAHGFSSSAMFCLAYFSYQKSHTRHIPYMKGMLQLYPVLSLFWFLFCCINMACPPTLNLLGEMSIVPVLLNVSGSLAIIMGLMVFFSASYNMYLYSSINHGSSASFVVSGVSPKSYLMTSLMCHMLPLLLILKSNLFSLYYSW